MQRRVRSVRVPAELDQLDLTGVVAECAKYLRDLESATLLKAQGNREAAEALLKAGSGDLHAQRYRPAGTLAQADRRRLEIARALASEPKLLLLDEPSVGMDEVETDALVADIKRLRSKNPDLSVILIEHDMRVVEAFPTHVMCIDYGSRIAEGNFETVRADPRVQEAYLGKAAAHA